MTKYRHTKPSLEINPVRRDQPQICSVSGKRMYANEREANATAAHRMSVEETAGRQLGTYKCMYCGTWHLTSKQA